LPKTRKQGKSDNVSDLSTIPGARLAPLPLSVSPMLASIPTGPVGNDGWIFEPKMDGIRCIAIISGGSARLLSRRGLDLTNQYPVLAAELPSRVNGNAVIDGEIIALDAKGHPSFQQLQQRMNLTGPADIDRAEKTVPVYFYAFDIVHFDNHDLTRVRLMQRKMLLSQVVMESDRVRILSSFEGDGVLAYEACVENGFEGIVAKRKESFYESGRRSPS
jgi:bifunctional non-homologous end joining protein LigD